MAATAAMLEIYFALLLRNRKTNLSGKFAERYKAILSLLFLLGTVFKWQGIMLSSLFLRIIENNVVHFCFSKNFPNMEELLSNKYT